MTISSISINQATPPFFVGVDVGGTNIKLGIVDDSGQTVARNSVPTLEPQGPEEAMERVAACLDTMVEDIGLDPSLLIAVGLGTPGPIDIANGVILTPGNMPHWHNYSICERLNQVTGRKVIFANDANAAAFGEYWVGSGRNVQSMILFTLGTGVGGGIIINGMMVEGDNCHGGECGHVAIDMSDDARACTCGGRGHLEAYTSATSVVARTKEALVSGIHSSMNERIQAGEELSTLMLYEEASRGDELSLQLILETARYLGFGIAICMHVVDPGAVILGGAMDFGGHESEIGKRFLDEVRREIRRRALPVLAERTVVDFASLGGAAGYIGAAGVARRTITSTST